MTGVPPGPLDLDLGADAYPEAQTWPEGMQRAKAPKHPIRIHGIGLPPGNSRVSCKFLRRRSSAPPGVKSDGDTTVTAPRKIRLARNLECRKLNSRKAAPAGNMPDDSRRLKKCQWTELSPSLKRPFATKRANQFDDGPPDARISNLHKSLVELKPFPSGKKFEHVAFGGTLSKARRH